MTFILNRGLTEALFEGFFIQRWNDRIRPVNLTEADKNSSKMMLTLYIGKRLEDLGRTVEWSNLVDKGVFDALTRYAISDISSVVHAKLRENPDVYVSSISKIVIKKYSKLIPEDLMGEYLNYIKREKTEALTQEDKIIRLSHRLSLRLEYKIVSSLGYGSFFLPHEEKGEEINSEINQLVSELGLPDFLDHEGRVVSKELDLILKLTDRLRYQVRWSQTPRVPQTSVLGHSFYVACCVYFATKRKHEALRMVNNFYAALMHDFLEALTRDIISPLKNSSLEFKGQIDQIERSMLENDLLPNLEGAYRDYISILLKDEFSNRAFRNRQSIAFSEANEWEKFDGEIIQAADYYAALLEAHQSIDLGISSHHLVGAISRLYATFKSKQSNFSDKEMYNDFLDLYDSFIDK